MGRARIAFRAFVAGIGLLFVSPPATFAQIEGAGSSSVPSQQVRLQQGRTQITSARRRIDVPLPPARPGSSVASPKNMVPASMLFSLVQTPNRGAAQAIGYYPKGCLSGAQELPLIGPNWQVMRVSRNRYWGHPELVQFIERLAAVASSRTEWPGILIGDMSQPRGGPLPSGHASHQIGLDVDIWLSPMPAQPFSAAETDTTPMASVVMPDGAHLDPTRWKSSDATLIKLAAQDRDVERIFVSPVIKKELCRVERPEDQHWMEKVRPWYGHRDHMHVRLRCPPGSPECRPQQSVPDGDGCGKSLDEWFSKHMRGLDNEITSRAPLERSHPVLRELPKTCVSVLDAPGRPISTFAHQMGQSRGARN